MQQTFVFKQHSGVTSEADVCLSFFKVWLSKLEEEETNLFCNPGILIPRRFPVDLHGNTLQNLRYIN